MELSFGLLETLGEVIGEKEETSGSFEASITSELSTIAHGQLLLILGRRTSETKQSQKPKNQ